MKYINALTAIAVSVIPRFIAPKITNVFVELAICSIGLLIDFGGCPFCASGKCPFDVASPVEI